MIKPLSRRALVVSLVLVFGAFSQMVIAVEPFPGLPPTLSTSVAPNVILYIDTSGSMLQDVNNNWMLTNLCDSNSAGWSNCVNNNTNNYRTSIDSATVSPNTKMNIAKRVAKNLVNNNSKLRFGLFSFEDKPNSVGGAERGQGAILRYGVADMSNATKKSELFTAIDSLNGRTSTPLGEGLLEITQYLRGSSSLYGKTSTAYTSPIQYRCQKNFAIVVTDGDATDENNVSSVAYKAIDASGNHVDKAFNVCVEKNTTPSNDLDVNCPESLEGFSATPGFGSASNRFRALRDVSKYAKVADLLIGGNDLDGKSFDDPKFKKQNLYTYTIGFGVNNEVLPAAAEVGGGKYYTANNESTLTTALQTAVNGITDSISNAGGVAVQSEISAAGNKLFQPVFNPAGWYGELRCFEFDSNSISGIGSSCSPNAKAVIPTSGRVIHTSKIVPTVAVGDNETSKFSFAKSNLSTMTASQQAVLGSDATSRGKVIDFIRGVEGISGFRSRYNNYVGSTVLLGDIIDGQPVVVSAPKGATPDADYTTYKTQNATRNIVFVGANDGMLHAFRVNESTAGANDNMKEIMGYVPSTVYPRLKNLTASDYGTTTQHTYHVNGVLRYEDVKLSNGWTTLVVGGLGQGGQGYYAIDAKNEANLATPANAIKWEWSDVQSSEVGYSFGSPLIYNVRISSTQVVPAVIVANGYESDYDDTASGGMKTTSDVSALFILNAETGALIKAISVPGGTGLSSPAGVDVGQDGILDYVYAGDLSGKMWRFDLTSTSPSGFKVVTPAIFDAGSSAPIVTRPAVLPLSRAGGGGGNLILFGTGKLLTENDRTNTTQQSIYGILDKMEETPITVPDTFSGTTLVQQTFVGTYTNSAVDSIDDGVYRKVSDNFIDLLSSTNTNLGWAIRLPDVGERLVTTPLVYNDKVIFGTGTPFTTEKCLPGGAGWVLGLNPLTGSVVRKKNSPTGSDYSFIDLNRDGKSSATGDKVPFLTGSSYVSGYKKDGIPTELTFIATSAALSGPANPSSNDYGSAGAVVALREANSMGVFTGNGRGTETVGSPIKRQDSDGKGKLCGGTIGTADLDCRNVNGAPTGAAKVEATIWREIR